MNKTRANAVAAMLITGFAVIYAVGSAVAGWEPSQGWLLQAIIHVGELLAVVALASSGVGAASRTVRTALSVATVGQAILVVAEVVWPHNADIGNVLFGIGPILTGVALIVAGAVLIRRQNSLPLILGLYTVVVLIPVLIASGGPPAAPALWAIAGWDLLWFALSAIILSRARAARPEHHASSRVTVR